MYLYIWSGTYVYMYTCIHTYCVDAYTYCMHLSLIRQCFTDSSMFHWFVNVSLIRQCSWQCMHAFMYPCVLTHMHTHMHTQDIKEHVGSVWCGYLSLKRPMPNCTDATRISTMVFLRVCMCVSVCAEETIYRIFASAIFFEWSVSYLYMFTFMYLYK